MPRFRSFCCLFRHQSSKNDKMKVETNQLKDIWRNIIEKLPPKKGKSWVVFKHGTCVIINESTISAEETETKGKEIMAKWGPVFPGCPAGDFNVFKSPCDDGWVVTGHCPDMFTFVSLEEGDGDEIMTGLLGRDRRDKDGRDPKVVHVEHKG